MVRSVVVEHRGNDHIECDTYDQQYLVVWVLFGVELSKQGDGNPVC